MDDIKGFAKKYWPYLLGGGVGIFLIMKMSGSKSQTVVMGGGDGGAFLAAQGQIANEGAAIAMQGQIAQMQIDAQARENQAALDFQASKNLMDFDLGLRKLDNEQNQINANAMVQFQVAQAAMADSVSTGAAGVIGQLSAPTIAAINSAGLENVAAMNSAAMVAAAGYLAQSDMTAASSNMVGSVAGSLGATNSVLEALASRPDKTVTAGQVAGNALNTYLMGGMGGGYAGGGMGAIY